jgi:predicted transcriptional regulator
MSKTYLTERINLWLDAELLHSLENLASRGDRTVAAEMRRALRSHVLARQINDPMLPYLMEMQERGVFDDGPAE